MKLNASFLAYNYGEPSREDVPIDIYKDFVDCNAGFIGMGQDWSSKTFLVTQTRNKEG